MVVTELNHNLTKIGKRGMQEEKETIKFSSYTHVEHGCSNPLLNEKLFAEESSVGISPTFCFYPDESFAVAQGPTPWNFQIHEGGSKGNQKAETVLEENDDELNDMWPITHILPHNRDHFGLLFDEEEDVDTECYHFFVVLSDPQGNGIIYKTSLLCKVLFYLLLLLNTGLALYYAASERNTSVAHIPWILFLLFARLSTNAVGFLGFTTGSPNYISIFVDVLFIDFICSVIMIQSLVNILRVFVGLVMAYICWRINGELEFKMIGSVHSIERV